MSADFIQNFRLVESKFSLKRLDAGKRSGLYRFSLRTRRGTMTDIVIKHVTCKREPLITL